MCKLWRKTQNFLYHAWFKCGSKMHKLKFLNNVNDWKSTDYNFAKLAQIKCKNIC